MLNSTDVDQDDDGEMSDDESLYMEVRYDSRYVCRKYFRESSSSSLLAATSAERNERGRAASKYAFAYAVTKPGGGDAFDNEGEEDSVIYSAAFRRLHLSSVPERLLCREEETEKIMTYLRKNIAKDSESSDRGDDSGSSTLPIYLCGLPGTGKTALVLTCIAALKKEVALKKLRPFKFVDINCLKMTNPRQAYSALWQCISGGAHLPPRDAQMALEMHFGDRPERQAYKKRNADPSAPSRDPVVCLVDEVDFMLTKDENVIFNFLDWPLRSSSSLIIILIANIMDLPERLKRRGASRVSSGEKIERIAFKSYKPDEMMKILKGRLAGLKKEILDSRALEMLARKVCAHGTDVRAALSACQR